MALVRKLRKVGSSSSLSVIIPADFVKALGLEAGDPIEFIPESRDTFRMRRAIGDPRLERND